VWARELLVGSRPIPLSQESPFLLSAPPGKTKELCAKLALSPSTPVDAINEMFGIPHTIVIEPLETCSGQVLLRTRVYTY
jgi:hypothetical protein